MITRMEGHFAGFKKTDLFYQTWTVPQAIGTLVVTHGLGEHSDCYNLFANAMCPKGWNVISWDLRGHGRSEGRRGCIDQFSDFAHDLQIFLYFLKQHSKLELPYFLVSHSMGGLITLRYATELGVDGALGICLSSPLIGVAAKVPVIKDFAAKVLFNIAPNYTMFNELQFTDLTRDPEILKTYPKDSLRHDKISPGLYFGILDSIKAVHENVEKISVPFQMQLAGADKVVSTPASQNYFGLVKSEVKKLIVYPENHHEIFNDIDREQVFKDLDLFTKSLLPKG